LDGIRISRGAISYLTTMAIRLYYIHKVLKETGSFYLHCDSTMSHYLKIVCDLIFGEKNFINEIIWKRTFNSGSSKSISKKFPHNTDTILWFSKSKDFLFNPIMRPLNEGALKRYDKEDDKGRFMWVPLKTVSAKRLEALRKTGEIREEPELKYPRYKKYLDSKGVLVDNLWDDVGQIATHPDGQERLGYPTQKPEALLERIIKASSNEGDLVADFFCGCGTSIAVAQRLNRKWLGVDISHLAIRLILDRLTQYANAPRAKIIRDSIQILGFPRDVDSAKMLARESDNGRFGFQDWIIELMLGGVINPKKTADGGFDGYVTFYKSEKEKGLSIIEVKSGHVNVKNVREFIQVVKVQKADHGVFVCFQEQVTKPMLLAAKEEGYFYKELWESRYDKIQILTVEDILDGKGINLPMEQAHKKTTFKTATKSLTPNGEQLDIDI
jgi:DNA modification methylase